MPPARILVVDDDLIVAKVLTRLLKRRGYEVRTVNSGPAALAVLEAFQPAAVLCDFRMPGMSGVEVLIEIKQRSPSTMRIMISGYADASTPSSFAEADIFEFIAKPWDDARLIDALERALAQRDQRAA